MTACVPVLSGIAGDPSRGIRARTVATHAVMNCADREQRYQLRDQLTASPEALPRRLFAGVVGHADPGMDPVKSLLASLAKLDACRRCEATGLRPSLHDFTRAQENEPSNRQRPDIWTQSTRVASAVPIELRVLGKGWSGTRPCKCLCNQLAGDRLREETAGCCVILQVWQGQPNKRIWEISGKRFALPELRTAFGEHWETVSQSYPCVAAIEVISPLPVRSATPAISVARA